MGGAVSVFTLVWLHHMQGHDRKIRDDAGIAIGPILFVIALLGILAAAIAAGSGAFSSSTSTESAKAAAQAIIDYGEQLQNGVDVMLGRGVDPLNLSFSHSVNRTNGTVYTTTYDQNTNCTDDSCELFKPSGGGVVARNFYQYQAVPTVVLGDGLMDGSMGFYTTSVEGLGSSANELIMRIEGLSNDVCASINTILNFTQGSISYTSHYIWWQAGGIPSNVFTLGGAFGGMNGARRFCWNQSGFGAYYVVLIVN